MLSGIPLSLPSASVHCSLYLYLGWVWVCPVSVFGNGFWFSLVIFTGDSAELILIPLYLNFRFFDFFGILPDGGFNLLGSAWPFILPAITASGFRNGLYIYIMRQILGSPKELEEAAYVDGLGRSLPFQVVLPGSIHGLVVVFLFSFVWMWNDYSLTSFTGRRETPAHYVKQFNPQCPGGSVPARTRRGSLVNNAGSFLIILPLLLLYAFLQRYFVESIERTGLVG